MLNTPFVIVFVPVAGGTAMRLKEKVPEVPVAVRMVNVIIPLPPSTAFASQTCVPPMVSRPFAPLERLIGNVPGPLACVAIPMTWAFAKLVTLSDPTKDTMPLKKVAAFMQTATHDTALIWALIDPVAPLLPGQLDRVTGLAPVVVLPLDPHAAVTSNIGNANKAGTSSRRSFKCPTSAWKKVTVCTS
jgi:hypothetical protein